MEQTLGVTGPQRMVIRIVGRFPGITAGQLAKILHVHPSTLTGILKRLERQNIVARRLDPRDQRRVLLGLSPKGRRFDVETEGTIEAVLQRALTGVSARQVRSTAEILRRITVCLGQISA